MLKMMSYRPQRLWIRTREKRIDEFKKIIEDSIEELMTTAEARANPPIPTGPSSTGTADS